MGTPVTEIIDRVRMNVSDYEQEVGFTDTELTGWVNAANRFLRRIVLANKPRLLASAPITGTLAAGTNKATLNVMPMRIISVRIDGKTIVPVSPDTIEDLTDTGTPTKYYLLGLYDIMLHPVPDKQVSYSITIVPENTSLTLESSLPLPNDFDDAIIEYTTIRAQLRNEFDMSQELSIMSTVVEQITSMLRAIEPKRGVVAGYYGGANG